MATKLNSVRLLESRGIPFTCTEYDSKGEFHSADEAAKLIGVSPDVVFKTLVVLRESQQKARPILVMIPSNRELDLKLLARAMGEKKLRMATQKEAESLTGLQVGGISALALLNRPFDVCIDDTALSHEQIHISAGKRGVDLELGVRDIIALTQARRVQAATG